MGGQHHKATRDDRASKNSRKSRPNKRKQYFNPKTAETDENSFSASRKKMRLGTEVTVPLDYLVEYRILNFIQVFSALSQFVKCKTCDGDIKFAPTDTRGLGFKIAVICDKCEQRNISSCTYINHSYEVNRRFILTMGILGLGQAGCAKFCGLMDMPSFLYHSTYDQIIAHICTTVKSVFDSFIKLAAKQEIEKTNGPNKDHLTVSGDGTWKKRGFTSLLGVSSLIGYYTGKILDIQVKSAYCKMCELWSKKSDTTEYEEWKKDHEPSCTVNHIGSSGKMEVDGITEMFKRSENLHGVKYIKYVGDGDSKTFNGILKASPYGEIGVIKKECVGHVQKRMGTRLRELKKKNKELGGKGKLTGKMIDKLAVYYGLAIRRHANSAEAMESAIWATYSHYSSTDEAPHHEKCPPGSDSWCEWQRAYTALPEDKKNEITDFEHTYKPLPPVVLEAIKPIYVDLSKRELLDRCVGGFTQNNNESYNQLIWKISPKSLPGGALPVKIAAYTSACTFNEGNIALLKIFEALGVPCGRNAHEYITKEDEIRITIAEQRAHAATREQRMARRQHQLDVLEVAEGTEGTLYGPGIDDSI